MPPSTKPQGERGPLARRGGRFRQVQTEMGPSGLVGLGIRDVLPALSLAPGGGSNPTTTAPRPRPTPRRMRPGGFGGRWRRRAGVVRDRDVRAFLRQTLLSDPVLDQASVLTWR
ncbi:hypothetical protein PAHAL_7G309200 [Panicum hallii]|jgi:hypothetical protein|uniref:Uncharacterized protein n=1 Tax=Panicum hallii TaxID=206008 RepID=A0A2T8IE54_9POAL|nr:hypothetical protein PAHAL_7G309200 [Panicum hallii]